MQPLRPSMGYPVSVSLMIYRRGEICAARFEARIRRSRTSRHRCAVHRCAFVRCVRYVAGDAARR